MKKNPAPGRIFLLLIMPALFFAGCGDAVEVKEATLRTGDIQESFTEPARTRLSKEYRVTMPVGGRITRIDLEPGDKVKSGQPLAKFDLVPFEQAVAEAKAMVAELKANVRIAGDLSLENIALVQARLEVDAAEDLLNASNVGIEALEARVRRAEKELERHEKLKMQNAVSDTALDDARLSAEILNIELRREEFARASLKTKVAAARMARLSASEAISRKKMEKEILAHRLAQAQARLARAEHELSLATLKSPIDGVVLERYEQGDRTLPAGTPLLLIGDLVHLEVVAEVLTQDAMRLAQDSEVILEPAAGVKKIGGKVELIEPAGFTKLSSLGVEQQRVNVIVSFDGRPEKLGVGYQLQARFLTGSKPDALIVPRFSVLQAPDGSFYVFKIAGKKLVKQSVKIGLRSDLELEVTDGLTSADRIVAVPDTTMEAGMKVKVAGK